MEGDASTLSAVNTLPPALSNLVVGVVVALIVGWGIAAACIRMSITELLVASLSSKRVVVLPGLGAVVHELDSYSRKHLRKAVGGAATVRKTTPVRALVLPIRVVRTVQPARLTVFVTHDENGTNAAPSPSVANFSSPSSIVGGVPTELTHAPVAPDIGTGPLPAHPPAHPSAEQQLQFELQIWSDCAVYPAWGVHAAAIEALHTRGANGLAAFVEGGGTGTFLAAAHAAMVEWHVRGQRVSVGRAGEVDIEVDVGRAAQAVQEQGEDTGMCNPYASQRRLLTTETVDLSDMTSKTNIRGSPTDCTAAGVGLNSVQVQLDSGSGALGAGVGIVPPRPVMFGPGDVLHMDEAILLHTHGHNRSRGSGAEAGLPTVLKLSLSIPDIPPLTLTEDQRVLLALVITPLDRSEGEVGLAHADSSVRSVVVLVHLSAPAASPVCTERASIVGEGEGVPQPQQDGQARVPVSPLPPPPPPPVPMQSLSYDTHSTTLAVLDSYSVSVEEVYDSSVTTGQAQAPSCVVCLSAAPDVLLLPCRHMAVCTTCLTHLDMCPVCRAKCAGHMVVSDR